MSSGVRYTRERLAEAAEQCTSLDEVMAFFGTRPYVNARRHLARRFAHFGIDISHFDHRGTPAGRKTRPAAQELCTAVAESISIAGTLRRLQRSDTCVQRALLRRWIAEAGISTAHFLGQAHHRGSTGTVRAKRPEDILVKHDGRRRTRTRLLRRALREVGVPEQCAECGIGSEWRGDPMTLEVDHIDGDWSDDRQENLRLMCPNCHATTSTWCRGGGRRTA
ncbi:HNH endonuclease [Streptomyces sp. SID685]|uniref:HNH endonuclease n=1 Tax=Streptomyces sp. SID685 TaxID=2690322 RepID=UPI001369E780|nr:HNH endonuclease signature motif containing protein [Streptomyces sp. SID685]MYR90436.1 HNH endonuclease [Streptomyces sp. SID685]